MKIFITGSTSFVGKNLIKELLKQEYTLFLYKRKDTDISFFDGLVGDFSFVDDDSLDACFSNEDIELVIHLATFYGNDEHAEEIMNANVIFPQKILNLAFNNNVKTFINTDSFFSKDEFSEGYKVEYVRSKRNFLSILKEAQIKIKIINMRLEHVFGMGDGKTKFVEWLSNKIIANDVVDQIMLSSCNQLRDFITADDVASSYIQVIKNIDSIRTFTEFQVGRGETISVKDFVNVLADEFSRNLGKKIEIDFNEDLNRPGEIKESYALNENLLQLGWIPKTDLNTDIKSYVAKKCSSIKK